MKPYNLNGGRPRKLTDTQVDYIKNNIGQSFRKLANELGVSHTTIYKTLKDDKTTKTTRRPHSQGRRQTEGKGEDQEDKG